MHIHATITAYACKDLKTNLAHDPAEIHSEALKYMYWIIIDDVTFIIPVMHKSF